MTYTILLLVYVVAALNLLPYDLAWAALALLVLAILADLRRFWRKG